jgi:hypothetical protein
MNKAMVIIVSCALLVIPSLAQNVLNLNNCSPVGTWYGGSDVKYQLIITPITGERFAIWGTVVAAIGNLGYPGWSPWAGEMTKTKSGRYVFQEIALYTTSPDFPPPLNSFELDAVHGWGHFTDCTTIEFGFDYYVWYFDLDKVPFVDQPDGSIDASGIHESYKRMPTSCPACSLPVAPSALMRPKH